MTDAIVNSANEKMAEYIVGEPLPKYITLTIALATLATYTGKEIRFDLSELPRDVDDTMKIREVMTAEQFKDEILALIDDYICPENARHYDDIDYENEAVSDEGNFDFTFTLKKCH